jgi:myo-inositol-1(or 4)-monophosphatase
MTDYYKERAAAIEAVLSGGEVLKRHFGGRIEIAYKEGELDLVTTADMESERAIVSLLTNRFPEVTVLAEEGGESAGDANRRFIVDPLDGTTNFAHGYPHFAVSIGYEEYGEVRVGVVYDPLREELFAAERDDGAYLNGKRIGVSDVRDLGRALLVTGFPYDLKEDVSANLRYFNRFMSEARAIRRDGSAALDLCYVAAGRFDGFWEEKLSPWDTAAGALLVREASGRTSDFLGRPFDCFGKSVVASNGALHDAILRVLNAGNPE